MRRSMLITTLTALSLGAAANDGVELRTKALASAGASSVSATNYVKPESNAYGRDPISAIVQSEATPGWSGPSATCSANASAVCYDALDGRIVYRGAREYMPKMDGFQPESVSLRRNGIIFKYSFK
ncbi:MAG TPA: hypothetical protein VKR38_07405 [Usitatibacter sp.]|nr:hypothetical protein [Usitatibacter sp.]